MATSLITGASGFLGRHLFRRLQLGLPDGDRLVAIGRRRPEACPDESFHRVDLVDPARLIGVVSALSPDLVYHLAGKIPPGEAGDYDRGNTLATLHLLDALRACDRPCRVVLVGSAAELGPVPVDDLPVGEDYPSRPVEAYGLSKWLATSAGLAARPPLEVVVARVFNPIGPGLPPSQALGRFAEGLASGRGPIRLVVGDLRVKRDFVDARDVAGALIALASRGLPGRIYNVGTGRSRRLAAGLDRLIDWSGREVHLEVDPDRARAPGPADSRADVDRIAREVGWSAEVPFLRSLRDLWDEAVAKSGRD